MKYEEYKDSGVEWMGIVPSHWVVCKIKHKYQFKTGGTPSSGKKEFYDGELKWANISDINGSTIYDTAKHITEEAVKSCSMTISPKGSLLYSFKLSVGQVAFCGDDMYTNEAIATFESKTQNLRYLYYIAPQFIIHNANRNIYNAPLLNQDLIKNAIIVLPPIEEQNKIVTYLDKKCEEIDRAIDTQKKKIELLNELKQTIITNAVTRGLNPDAPMKDSGAEWIGKVPVHWDVCKIKNILQQGPDSIKIGPFGSSLTGKIGENLGYKVYGQWNIVGGDFNAGTNTVDSETFNALSKSYRVVSGDILVSMMGTIGKCAIIPEDIQDGIMDSHVVKIRLDRSKMKTDFFEYFYDKDKSNVIYNQLQKVKGGSIMDGLNSSVIKNLTIATPPIGEQEEIVKYIKGRIQNIETQIFKTKRRIELLNELKQSIITEAVTGKVKVC